MPQASTNKKALSTTTLSCCATQNICRATSLPSMMISSLLSLVDELLLGIIEQIDDHKDLLNFCLSCSHLQALAEPLLYQNVLVRTGQQAIRLAYAIRKRPMRARAIRSLQIRYLQDYASGIESLNPVLKLMSQLRNLTIESPCCNDRGGPDEPKWVWKGRIDYSAFFEFASSTTLGSEPRIQISLQSFTLHSHGGEDNKFNLGKNAIIVLHPTLRNLTLSCFDIGDDLSQILNKTKKSTPLKKLILVECNITSSGLAAILSVPKGLEKLVIGERKYHTSHIMDHRTLRFDHHALLQALKMQSHSLQYLKHIGGNTWPTFNDSFESTSLTFLSKLLELEIDEDSIWNSMFQYLSPRGRLPPQLRKLRLFTRRNFAAFDLQSLLVMISWLRNVQKLDYVLDYYRTGGAGDIIDELWSEAHMKQIYDFTIKLKSRGVQRLKIFISVGWDYIPPYMFGEVLPEEHLAYDSLSPLIFGNFKMNQPDESHQAKLPGSIRGQFDEDGAVQ